MRKSKLKILCIWIVQYNGKLTYEQYNVFPALMELKHDVKFYMLEKINEIALLDVIVNFKPDIILFKSYSKFLRPELMYHITYGMGFKTIGWMGDDEKFIDNSLKYAGCVSYIATNYKKALDIYKQKGQKAVWFPFAANDVLFKYRKMPKIYDCSFVGAIRPTRVFYLDKLANAGLKIYVRGFGWKQDNSTMIDISDYVNIINQTKVNLDVSEDIMKDNKLIEQVKGRDFEVPMAGGFLLTKDTEEIREFYKPNKEVVLYKDFNEFIDKAKYYVKHDSQREKIAKAGHIHAQKCHKYTDRLKQLFKGIE